MRSSTLLALVPVIAGLACPSACLTAQAAEETRLWRAAGSDEFRQGFVAGIASYLTDFQEANNAAVRAGYADCFAGQTDRSLLKLVDDYIDRHPETLLYTPDMATMLALKESCNGFMPRAPAMPP